MNVFFLTTALDSVDHSILVERLRQYVGLSLEQL